MKKLNLLLAAMFFGLFISCSKSDSGTGDTGIQSISIATDFVNRYTGESFTFTVVTNEATDVSSQAVIIVNNVPIVGNVFTPTTAGSYAVKATFSNQTSQVIFVNVTVAPIPLTSITLTSNLISAMTGDNLAFVVTGNNTSVLSTTSTIFVDNVAITGNNYTATTTGTLSVYATYLTSANVTLTSPTIQITVQQAINFNKRVLIEDYTGTWCQYCPSVSYALEQVHSQTTDAVSVAIHRGSSDPYNFAAASALESMIGLVGYPTGMLNRKTEWTYPETSNITQAVNLTSGVNPRVGLALNTSLSGNTVTVEVNVKFGQNFSNLKLVVYALQDNLVYNQTNSTIYYGGVNPIVNFDYDDVLRAYLTNNILGDAITGATGINDIYTKTFTYTIPSNYVTANMHFAAFVVDSTGKALNVRKASNNESQSFEIE
jgi:hypothetical protein